MNRKFIIDSLPKDIKYSEEQRQIIKSIEEAKEELSRARQYFELVSNPNLVDYAIYMEQAAKSRYSYLLAEAKDKGVEIDVSYVLMGLNAI